MTIKRKRTFDTTEIDKFVKFGCSRASLICQINENYYYNAMIIAKESEKGRAFTDHNIDHIVMVVEKTNEASKALKQTIINRHNVLKDHIAFSDNIEKEILLSAALSHDTGMAGNGYAIETKNEDGRLKFCKDDDDKYIVHAMTNQNFDEIRKNHSLNSALNILKNREYYKNMGFEDLQIDCIAVECMAHSKRNSGVANINSISDWMDCFDRLTDVIAEYNKDHNSEPIFFDRKALESFEILSTLATETFLLRIGDVSRDSGPGAISQSGERVYVNRDSINNDAKTYDKEVEKAEITIGDNREPITDPKSRPIHAGEQNITMNKCYCNSAGRFTHEITIADGNSAPKCTQESLNDHLGELASAGDEEFDVRIVFGKKCNCKQSYINFKDLAAAKFGNVNIYFPWDKEENYGSHTKKRKRIKYHSIL